VLQCIHQQPLEYMLAKFVMNIDEVTVIIREIYNLPETVEIEISDEEKEINEWIDVPSDWKNEYPPQTANDFNRIDIMYRDGEISTGQYANYFEKLWSQDNYWGDIVKYREHRD